MVTDRVWREVATNLVQRIPVPDVDWVEVGVGREVFRSARAQIIDYQNFVACFKSGFSNVASDEASPSSH